MAGRKINTFSLTGNANVDSIEESVDKTNKGKCAVSLTEMDTAVVPKIAGGSAVEVNGALFIFEADETISGTPSDGTVYIKLIPAGSPVTLTAQFTNTAPVWDKEKQGWYSPTSGEENYRYLPFAMIKSGSSYFKLPADGKSRRFYPKIIGTIAGQSIPADGNPHIISIGKKIDLLDEINISSKLITLSRAGFYKISAVLAASAPVTSDVAVTIDIYIYKNGANLYYSRHFVRGSNTGSYYSISSTIPLLCEDFFNVNDTISFYVVFFTNGSFYGGNGSVGLAYLEYFEIAQL